MIVDDEAGIADMMKKYFLTARIESNDKIIGFRSGADDYIVWRLIEKRKQLNAAFFHDLRIL